MPELFGGKTISYQNKNHSYVSDTVVKRQYKIIKKDLDFIM